MPKDTTSIDDIIKDVGKRYNVRLGAAADTIDDVSSLSTGNIAIDYITGVGGIPVGRITELYGQPSSGKTTTALQCAAVLQHKIISEGSDDCIAYLDFEHALDARYCAALGIDTGHRSFVVVQPHWLEEGADIAEKLIRTGKVRLSIWDSVAEMTPRDLEFGVRTNAMERARLMNSLLQRLNSLLHEQDCAGVFLNHMTEAISMGPTRPGMPPQETSPGGKALKYYSSLRLAFKQIKTVRGKATDALSGETIDQIIATNVRVKITKNKVGIPHREADVRVRFGAGFDNVWSALQILVAHKKIVVTGAYHYFDTAKVPTLVEDDMDVSSSGRPYLHGEANLLAFADTHPDWRKALITEAQNLIDAFGPPIITADEDEGPLPVASAADFAAAPAGLGDGQ